MIFKDLTGLRFTRLIVLECIKKHNGKRWHTYWRCKCDCGNEIVTMAHGLNNGGTKSCGCYNRDIHFKHGHTANKKPSLTFCSWDNAISRCYYTNGKDYARYGGRGIKVCERWKNSFENFLADMGERPQGKTLDRIDSNKDYSPENCKWSTPLEQNKNKTNSIKITYSGETKNSVDWGKHFGVSNSTILRRHNAGKDISNPQTSRNYYKEKAR